MSILKFQTCSRIIIKLVTLVSCALLVNRVHAQQQQTYTAIRSAHIPISVINKLSYLHFNDLCQAKVTYQEFGVQLAQWPIQKQSQLQQLANNNGPIDIAVLLDTGSNELWLADSGCSTCSLTKSLCPHLSSPSKKISYFKGFIQGADSYINICNNRIKFLCVKNANNIGDIQGEGILGLKSHSTGFNLLFDSLFKNKYETQNVNRKLAKNKLRQDQVLFIEIHSLQFIHGVHENYIHINNVRQIVPLKINFQQRGIEHQIYSGSKIKCDSNWSFNLQQISFMDELIILKSNFLISDNDQKYLIKAQIDTGSTQIVLSSDLCEQFFELMKSQMDMSCRYEPNQGIDCSHILKTIKFALKIEPHNENKSTTISINDKLMLDQKSNRIHILCQPASNENKSTVILGYPFLNSFSTTFSVESHLKRGPNSEQIVRQDSYFITVLKQSSSGQNQNHYSKLIMAVYIGVAVAIAWGFITLLDYVRDKRSTKIII